MSRYKAYPEYRDSGSEWLGQVPEGWLVKHLRYAASYSNSNVDKKSYEGQDEVSLCNYTDVYYNEFINSAIQFMGATASKSEIERFTLQSGDVLITKDSEDPRDIGVPALVSQDMPGVICGYHLSVIRAKECSTGRYLHRFLQSHATKAHFFVESPGITRYGLSQSAIGGLDVCLPSHAKQAAIADYLDNQTTRIDTLIEKKTRFIELLKEKRQALITHAVTKGLDPDVPMKDSGVEWIGEVPNHWKVVQLKRVASDFCDGPFGSGLKSEHYTDSGVRVVRLQNIGWNRFKADDAVYIDFEYWKKGLRGSHEIRSGDVLIAGLGDENNVLGRACVAPPSIEPAMVKADCYRFRLNKSVRPGYIAQALSATSLIECGFLATGATRARLNLTLASARIIPLPPEGEQSEIIEFSLKQSSRIETLIEKTERSIELLKEKRSALITAAVTGKIDVRDTAQEAT